MGQYTDSIARFLQYSFKVLPELHKQAEDIAVRQNLCMKSHTAARQQAYIADAVGFQGEFFLKSLQKKQTFREELYMQNQSGANTEAEKAGIYEQFDNSMLCSCFFALYPEADMKSTLTFILSLYTLSETLGAYRSIAGFSLETEVRKLYSCLSSAVDPARSKGCALANITDTITNQKRGDAYTPCLSDQCRLQLAILPNFQLVAPKLKKYIQQYVDIQSYRFYPVNIRAGYLETWSEYYLKRYQEISCWEFCAASNSLLGIIAMYTAAANPKLTSEDIRLLDEACFPWLSGLDSLLHAYICERITNLTENLNFTSYYRNLKICEERILFFAAKAEEACMKLRESSFFISLIKIITSLYLTHPEANFGMYKLVSSNILKKSSFQNIFYSQACQLMRLSRLI